jgi:hypothetical protein
MYGWVVESPHDIEQDWRGQEREEHEAILKDLKVYPYLAYFPIDVI